MRLTAGELTDVGRKRDRNQDNVTHFIPPDENVLEEKGALFVVCDGMGGHAAGEVAAELGVKTIREAYYASRSKDTINALAAAIEMANDAIYNHAREHAELSGMGTTCVAAAIVDGRAFVVNIGDSRAYLVRDGKMRQVTRDHSWVAEQVRVGLLTEEQARTHSHRNVITRSLGTQPNVMADLFVETMQNGDRLLLCSDGLHGYVENADIEREMTGHSDPDLAAQNLINMANENGGPDNITALIVHLIDVPTPTNELVLPSGDLSVQGTTQPMPAAMVAKAASGKISKPARSATASRPSARAAMSRTNNLILILRVLVAVLIVAIGVSIWYVELGPYAAQQSANQQLQTDIDSAQQVADQAQGQDPSQALAQLAVARQKLLDDLKNPNSDQDHRTAANRVLNVDLEPVVQQSIARYNQAALITPVANSDVLGSNVQCINPQTTATSTLASTDALVAVTMLPLRPGVKPNLQVLYGLSGGQVYQIRVPTDTGGTPTMSGITCTQMVNPGVTTIVALATDGSTMYALAQLPNAQYAVLAFVPTGYDKNDLPTTKVETRFVVPTPGGESPKLVAEVGGVYYVGYAGSATGTPGIWIFTGKAPKGPTRNIQLAQTAQALLATNGTLYMLLADGSLGQLDPTQQYLPLSVSVLSPLNPSSPDTYTIAAPVPTPVSTATLPATTSPGGDATATVGAGTPTPATTTAPTPSGTLFAKGLLVADPLQPMHLLVSDGANDRVVRFIASASGPGLGLGAQYVYNKQLDGATTLAISTDGTGLHAFTWSHGQLVTYKLPAAVVAGA